MKIRTDQGKKYRDELKMIISQKMDAVFQYECFKNQLENNCEIDYQHLGIAMSIINFCDFELLKMKREKDIRISNAFNDAAREAIRLQYEGLET